MHSDKLEELFRAVRTGSTAKAQDLLCQPGVANVRDVISGLSLLHQAAINGDCAMIELLIRNGADVNANDNDTSSSPLGTAATAGRLSAVRLLLEHGAMLAASETDIIDESADAGDVEIADLLRGSMIRG